MAVYGYTKNYKLVKPQFDSDTWHDYEYDNLDTIDAVLSAIYASGDWQGFWKTNTSYTAGSVVIDKNTDTMYKVLQDHTTDSTTFNEYYTAHPDYYRLWSPNNLAEDWAVKMDGDVETGEYSAKAHASSEGLVPTGSAKEWAIGSGTIGNTGEYSAKKYATDAHNDYISLTTNANVSAVGSNINNVNAVGQSISNVNTVAGNISSVNTVAGVSTDVSAVASVAGSVPAVADNTANITTVATNISDVNTAATNITAIQDAYSNANTAQNSATQAAQSAQTATDKANEASESAQLAVAALSLQIGDVFFVPLGIDESLNLRRYLNGQVLIQSQFVAFTNKIKSAIALFPNLSTTEENWQAEKAMSKLGQCGKFVVDDTAGTIRLPAVVNAQSLADLALIGMIKSESLPNITAASVFGVGLAEGAIETEGAVLLNLEGGGNPTLIKGTFNASRSSSAYQDNAPVQQEAVQYPYCIVVNTGVEESDRPINNYQVNNVYSYGMSQYYKGTMNNNSWLKSAGQWNSGTVYTGMYNWLLEQMNAGVSGFVASTDTYTDYDFVINTADQTFRLPLLNGERVLVSKKEATTEDQSWYNLYSDGWLEQGGYTSYSSGTIQTINLLKPYVNTGYSILESTVYNSVTQSTPSILHSNKTTNSFQLVAYDTLPASYWQTFGYAPVPAQSDFTEVKGLYYYIGDTLQNAQLVNVARIEEKLTDVNAASRGYVVESYHNGTEWYRVYSDGFIEQWLTVSCTSASTGQTFNFLKPFSDTNYTAVATLNAWAGNWTPETMLRIMKTSNTQFTIQQGGNGVSPAPVSVYCCGY